MAYVVAPSTDLRYGGTKNLDLGILYRTNDNKTVNHILAVELDTNLSPTAIYKSGNHVGININSIVSVDSANASYFDDKEGKNITMLLANGNLDRL